MSGHNSKHVLPTSDCQINNNTTTVFHSIDRPSQQQGHQITYLLYDHRSSNAATTTTTTTTTRNIQRRIQCQETTRNMFSNGPNQQQRKITIMKTKVKHRHHSASILTAVFPFNVQLVKTAEPPSTYTAPPCQKTNSIKCIQRRIQCQETTRNMFSNGPNQQQHHHGVPQHRPTVSTTGTPNHSHPV